MNEAQVVSRGVDWVTATAKGEHLEHCLWNVGEELLEAVRQPNGVDLERAELRGYRGWLGEGIFLGKRDDSVMLRGSSASAPQVYKGLYSGFERYTVTRIDLQVTGKFGFDNEAYGREAEAQALTALDRKAKKGSQRVASIRGNGRGDTCSFGSRSSQRYLRCYDKTREQHNQIEANLWRWEVEYKHPLSQGVAERIASHDAPDSAIVGTVATEFYRKGVTVPWVSGPAIEIPTTGVFATNDGRRLVWLNTQVRPVIGKLIASVGIEAVLIALDLAELLGNKE